ncbi:hypothetical protein GALMADRAFT_800915 [Galerina marginata CBS 339.88]|uniref:Uncharacterized protein n=1 Tax=Galerina marginata (strain CBS 339.88) TaxID=685588 RepID=A0A067SUN1_GALM3|nr:hypothetical protein GALMADRAFT_800915 [Galerina marginata CBS 339.88]
MLSSFHQRPSSRLCVRKIKTLERQTRRRSTDANFLSLTPTSSTTCLNNVSKGPTKHRKLSSVVALEYLQ